MACEILVSWPGSEPAFLGLEVQCLNHWTIGEVPVLATWKHHWPFVFQRTPKRCKQPISVQFSSVTQLSLTLCDPMDYSTPCFPVHHQLPELTQTHVHQVGDAIQASYPLLPPSPSPSALNHFQHQGLFQWVDSSYQVAKILELKLQYQSFQWIFRFYFL